MQPYIATNKDFNEIMQDAVTPNGKIDFGAFFNGFYKAASQAASQAPNNPTQEKVNEFIDEFDDAKNKHESIKANVKVEGYPYKFSANTYEEDENQKQVRNAFTKRHESIQSDDQILDDAFEYLDSLGITDEEIETMQSEFYRKFPDGCLGDKVLALKEIKPFAAGGNIFENSNGIDEPTLFVMRWLAGLKMQQALEILKFDLNDSNIMQDLSVGNIGTAQRWAKTITGGSLDDSTEMMCGRYTTKPRLATFPNNDPANIPITKRVDLSSVCSHHFLPYGTLLRDDSYAIISYIPGPYVLGISKLQRLADWVARRPTIQEDLAKNLWKEISEAAQTEDVYVGIFNARHTCEYLRGSQSQDGAFTTEYYRGRFEYPEIRKQAKGK